MKLSKDTINYLKSFATINSNLLLKKDSESISTISVHKNVIAEAAIEERFPRDFGIYDLNDFLGVLGLFADPDIDFKDKYARISEGSSSVKFFAADPSVLVVPTKKIVFPASDIDFTLTSAQLAIIQKTSAVLKAPDVTFAGVDGMLEVNVGDLKNPTSNSFNLTIKETPTTFKANLKVENMKLIPQDYNVSLSSKKISRFTGADGKLVVWIAMEGTSEF